jgi:hypothetical protein
MFRLGNRAECRITPCGHNCWHLRRFGIIFWPREVGRWGKPIAFVHPIDGCGCKFRPIGEAGRCDAGYSGQHGG